MNKRVCVENSQDKQNRERVVGGERRAKPSRHLKDNTAQPKTQALFVAALGPFQGSSGHVRHPSIVIIIIIIIRWRSGPSSVRAFMPQ
jgi:hypothetical protein